MGPGRTSRSLHCPYPRQRIRLGHLQLWNCLLKQGDLSQAITEWEQALHIQPDLAEVHYTLGQAYQIKGNTGRGQSKSIDRETMKEQEDRMKIQVPDDELEKEERSKS